MAKVSPIEIQKYLKGMDYPAKLEDLINKAKENNAPEEVMEVIQKIKDGEFRTPADVMRGAGEALRS